MFGPGREFCFFCFSTYAGSTVTVGFQGVWYGGVRVVHGLDGSDGMGYTEAGRGVPGAEDTPRAASDWSARRGPAPSRTTGREHSRAHAHTTFDVTPGRSSDGARDTPGTIIVIVIVRYATSDQHFTVHIPTTFSVGKRTQVPISRGYRLGKYLCPSPIVLPPKTTRSRYSAVTDRSTASPDELCL